MRKHSISLAVLALLALTGCAATAPAHPTAAMGGGGGTTLHVPAAREAECKQQGGCGLVSALEIERALTEAFNMGAAAGQQTCRRSGGA
jgi:hypothetical protein